MSKEVVKKQANEAVVYNLSEWGDDFKVGQDFLISKIWPMQGMSKLVMEGKATMGEFRNSVTGELLGHIDKGVEVIPFYLEKSWDVLEQQPDGQFKYTRSMPLIEDATKDGYNDNLKWEDVENGLKVRRVRRLNYYVLIPSEVEAGKAMPYVLSFKSTSLKAGKKLFTQMYVRNRMEKLPPPGYKAKITGSKVKNEKGIFVVLDCEQADKASANEIDVASQWFKFVRKGGVRVDNSDVELEASAADVGTGDF